MSTTGVTNAASFENVMRTQSSAIARDEADGFQARRPKTYQLAWSKSEPLQLRSRPMFATPAMPVSLVLDGLPPYSDPSMTFATVEPLLRTNVSAARTSSYSGPRYTRCVEKPRYSFVTVSYTH